MKVIIIGGGIAGLACGIALSQFNTIECAIYEKADSLRSEGAGITLTPNGIKALSHLGIHISDIIKNVPSNEFEYQSKYSKLSREGTKEYDFEFPMVTLPRESLMKALKERLSHSSSICVHLGVSFSSIINNNNNNNNKNDNNINNGQQVEIELSNGMIEKCDVLIAADGIFSSIRRSLFPHSSLEKATFTSLRGICNLEQSEEWGNDGFLSFCSNNKIELLVAQLYQSNDVYWVAYFPHNWEHQNFKEWHSPVPLLVPSTKRIVSTDIYFLLHPLPSWFRGSVLLVGDAAHPMPPHLGQGANMALEDATILSSSFSLIPSSSFQNDVWLSRFEEMRKVRVDRVVASSIAASNSNLPSSSFDWLFSFEI